MLRAAALALGLASGLALGLMLPVAVAGPAAAQEVAPGTLADVRAEIGQLSAEMQRLRDELARSNGEGAALAATLADAGVLDRVAAIEEELRRLTGRTEELEFRIQRIVADGTNRIADLEFRLTELEGGDPAAAAQVTPLGEAAPAQEPPQEPPPDTATPAPPPAHAGGPSAPPPRRPGAAPAPPAEDGLATLPVDPGPAVEAAPDPGEGAFLAVGEREDFDRARAAFEAGEYDAAAELFARFTESYPAGPLTPEAFALRARAQERQGDTAAAARTWLEAFNADPAGPGAADALLRLGRALAELGQREEACVMFEETVGRFPGSPAATEAAQARSVTGCP